MSTEVRPPAWQIVAIAGQPAAVAHTSGRWSVVVRGCCHNGETLDEALSRALLRDARVRAA